MPNSSWRNGGGLLGAEVGQGYLHRLPHTCRSTVGQSVERKVRTQFNKNDETKKIRTPVMERHLEMEIEKSTNPEQVSKQPHELGNALDTDKVTPRELSTDQVGAQSVSVAEATDPLSKLPNGPFSRVEPSDPVPLDDSIKKEKYSPAISDLPSPPKMSY